MPDESQAEQGLVEPAATHGDAAQTEKLSQEAAKWRTKFRELEAQLKDVAPKAQQYDQLQEAQKTEAQKVADQLAALQAQVTEATAQAQAAQAQAKLMALAARVGVDPDVANLLDISKIDLTDEAKATQQLQRFAKPSNGTQVKPGDTIGGMTEDDLRKHYFGGGRSKTTIFGG